MALCSSAVGRPRQLRGFFILEPSPNPPSIRTPLHVKCSGVLISLHGIKPILLQFFGKDVGAQRTLALILESRAIKFRCATRAIHTMDAVASHAIRR